MIPRNLNFKQKQVFGSQQPFQFIQQQDIIKSIQFDPTGEFLAIGDNAGRIILFKQQQDQFGEKKSFQYYSQFQSHLPQFDSLKSLTMNEGIKQLKWLKPQGKYKKMLTSNGNRLKLWKMFQKSQTKVILTGQRDSHFHQKHDFHMPLLHKEMAFTALPQLIFPVKHGGQINQMQITKNQQYVLTSDEDEILMWNFQRSQYPFILQQTSSKKNWKQGQKITCSKIHPFSDNIFAYGTSKGGLQLNDLRASLNNRTNINFLPEKLDPKDNNYFTEMTSKINSLEFLLDGKYLVSRDYLTVKIWDLCRPSSPLNTININQMLKEKLCSLFQKDCIEDEFQISSFSDNLIVSGTYDNRFNIIDPLNNMNTEYKMSFSNNDTKTYLNKERSPFVSNFDHNRKVISCGVHKSSKKIALASLNSFFIYSPEG